MKKFLYIALLWPLCVSARLNEPKHSWEEEMQYQESVIKCPDGSFCKRSRYAGFLDGPTTFTFPNSIAIEKEILYSRGQVIKETYYYPQGFARKETVYKPREEIEISEWYANGHPKCVERWAGSLLAHAEYYDNEGFALNKECLIQVKQKNNGVVKTYYSDNSIKEITPYKSGVAHGLRKTYDRKGQPMTHEKWVLGKQEGVTTLFEKGEKVEEIPYVAGVKSGKGFIYKDGHTIVAEKHWEDDKLHGAYRTFDCYFACTEWYYRGQKVSKCYFDSLTNPEVNRPLLICSGRYVCQAKPSRHSSFH